MYKPLPKILTIKQSPIDGLGLFATEEIPAGTSLGVSHVYHAIINDIIRTPLGGFYNHSELPNVEKQKVVFSSGDEVYTLEAIKDIKVGEEITCKYTFYGVD
jgi:SET domain-containing protein